MMQRRRASETLENIKGALMGYGTAKLKTFLAQALPDFDRHYQETAHSNAPQPPTGNVWTEGSAPYSSTSGQTHGSYGSPSSSGAGQQSTGYDRENAGVRSNPTL